jgi:hypothetical protein
LVNIFYRLAFLPPSEVGGWYAPNIKHVTHFADYVLNYYVSEDVDFNLSIWAAEPSDSPRTKNVPE